MKTQKKKKKKMQSNIIIHPCLACAKPKPCQTDLANYERNIRCREV